MIRRLITSIYIILLSANTSLAGQVTALAPLTLESNRYNNLFDFETGKARHLQNEDTINFSNKSKEFIMDDATTAQKEKISINLNNKDNVNLIAQHSFSINNIENEKRIKSGNHDNPKMTLSYKHPRWLYDPITIELNSEQLPISKIDFGDSDGFLVMNQATELNGNIINNGTIMINEDVKLNGPIGYHQENEFPVKDIFISNDKILTLGNDVMLSGGIYGEKFQLVFDAQKNPINADLTELYASELNTIGNNNITINGIVGNFDKVIELANIQGNVAFKDTAFIKSVNISDNSNATFYHLTTEFKEDSDNEFFTLENQQKGTINLEGQNSKIDFFHNDDHGFIFHSVKPGKDMNGNLKIAGSGITTFREQIGDENSRLNTLKIENISAVFNKPVYVKDLYIKSDRLVSFNDQLIIDGSPQKVPGYVYGHYEVVPEKGNVTLEEGILQIGVQDLYRLQKRINFTGTNTGISINENFALNNQVIEHLNNLNSGENSFDVLGIGDNVELTIPDEATFDKDIISLGENTSLKLEGVAQLPQIGLPVHQITEIKGLGYKDIEINKPLFAEKINIDGPHNVTFKTRSVKGNIVLNDDANIKMHDTDYIVDVISPSKTTIGKIEYLGSGKVGKIGSYENELKKVKFSGGESQHRELHGDIYAQKIKLDDGVFTLKDSISLNSSLNTNIAGAYINLGNNILNINSPLLHLKNNISFIVSSNGYDYGKVIINTNDIKQDNLNIYVKLDNEDEFSSLSQLNFIELQGNVDVNSLSDVIHVENANWYHENSEKETLSLSHVEPCSPVSPAFDTEDPELSSIPDSKKLIALLTHRDTIDSISSSEEDSSETITTTPITSAMSHVDSSPSHLSPSLPPTIPTELVSTNQNDNDLVLKVIRDEKEKVSIIPHKKITSLEKVIQESPKKEFHKVIENSIAKLRANDDENHVQQEKEVKFIKRMAKMDDIKKQESLNLINHSTDEFKNEVSAQMHVSDSMSHVIDNRIAMVSGDEDVKRPVGIWFMDTGNIARQGNYKHNLPYKLYFYGGSIGIDTEITDHTLVGMSAHYVRPIIKYRSGNKSIMKNYIMSLYKRHNYGNWQIQTNAFLGNGIVNVNKLRLIRNDSPKMTKGKFRTEMYGAELVLNYNYQLANQMKLTPTLGIKYTHLFKESYEEAGSGAQNMYIGERRLDLLTASAGLKASCTKSFDNGYIVPGVHALVNYNHVYKAPDFGARFSWQNETINIAMNKEPQLSFSLGGNVNVMYKNIDLGVSLNSTLRKKYQSYQASGKLRVNI